MTTHHPGPFRRARPGVVSMYSEQRQTPPAFNTDNIQALLTRFTCASSPHDGNCFFSPVGGGTCYISHHLTGVGPRMETLAKLLFPGQTWQVPRGAGAQVGFQYPTSASATPNHFTFAAAAPPNHLFTHRAVRVLLCAFLRPRGQTSGGVV